MSDITEIYRIMQWVERGLFLSFYSKFSIGKVKQEEIQNIQRKPIFTKGVPPLSTNHGKIMYRKLIFFLLWFHAISVSSPTHERNKA